MRIGMVSKFGEKDGIAIYSDSLVAALRKKGADMVTIGDSNSKADHNVNLKSFFLKKHVEKIIRSEKLKLVHFQYIAERSYYGLHTLNLNLINALHQKVPAISTMHEVHYDARTLSERIVKRLEEAVILKSNAVIVHTSGQKRYIERAYRRKAHRINMGVTLHAMHRRRGKNMLFFGMISEAKGVEYLIDAMQELKGWKLRIAGRIVSEPYAETLLMKAKGKKGITLDLGWIPEEVKHEYLQSADIMALPYVKAPYQSAVLHDAMSHGIPVIVTRTGALWDIVDEYRCGEIVEPKNKMQIAEAANRIWKNYQKYQKGIESYRKDANWEKAAEKHIQAYEEALGAR